MASAGNSVLKRLIEPLSRCLTPEAAREIVAVRAEPADQRRVEELATRNTEGILTEKERAEYYSLVMTANVLAIFQSKARKYLASKGE